MCTVRPACLLQKAREFRCLLRDRGADRVTADQAEVGGARWAVSRDL